MYRCNNVVQFYHIIQRHSLVAFIVQRPPEKLYASYISNLCYCSSNSNQNYAYVSALYKILPGYNNILLAAPMMYPDTVHTVCITAILSPF